MSSGSFQQVVFFFSCANFISMCLPVLMVTIWLLYFQASICLPDLKKKRRKQSDMERGAMSVLEKPNFPRNPRWTSVYVSLVVTGLLDHSDTQSHKRG